MADLSAQAPRSFSAMEIWPSRPWADWLYNAANITLLVSLVLGLIATFLVVWMGSVKEQYSSADQMAAQAGIAAANARAAEAIQKAEEERLARVRIEARLAPRTIPQQQQNEISAQLSRYQGERVTLIASPSTPESEWFVRVLGAPLKAAGWNTEILPGTPTATILYPSGVIVQYPMHAYPNGSDAAVQLVELLNGLGIAATALPDAIQPPLTMQIIVSPK